MKQNEETKKQHEKLQQEIMEKLKGLTVKEAKRLLYRTANLVENTIKVS